MGIIPDYFDKYYEAAVGIYSCGTGLGIMVIPLLTQYFLDIYGWRGTILLLCGLSFHSIPCGALLTPRKPANQEYRPLFQHADTASKKSTNEVKKHLFYPGIYNSFGLQLLAQRRFITQVLVPGFVWGYTLVGWMIYMVSLAVSKGSSIKEGSILATSGGIGMVAIRIALPLLHKVMTYKQLLYIASVVTAISLSLIALIEDYIALNFICVLYGLGIGITGGELYISAKVNSKECEHFQAISLLHLAYGVASIVSGFVTGKSSNVSRNYDLSVGVCMYAKPARHLQLLSSIYITVQSNN